LDPASFMNPLALRAFPPRGEKILDVSEIRLIAGIFSPSRGDARRAEGFGNKSEILMGRCPKGRGVLPPCNSVVK
jgi:hypothetical protein